MAKIGLDIECSPLSGAELVRWLAEAARTEHGKTLPREAAALMRELAGEDLGLLEQELAKLAAFVGDRADDRSGRRADARRRLADGDDVGHRRRAAPRAGRAKLSICWTTCSMRASRRTRLSAGLTFVFRRLAQSVERVREGASLDAAVREAGVFPREAGESAAYLKRLGRNEALRLYSRLLWADVNLKGGLTIAERQILETLVVNLGGTSVLPRRK